jgi:hypothetical protein
MTLRDSLSIAIPAVALCALYAAPGEPRWTARPWFWTARPRRGPIAACFAVLLVVAIARVLF